MNKRSAGEYYHQRKRNRYQNQIHIHNQNQNQYYPPRHHENTHHYNLPRYPRDQTSYDPTQHFERLSISRDSTVGSTSPNLNSELSRSKSSTCTNSNQGISCRPSQNPWQTNFQNLTSANQGPTLQDVNSVASQPQSLSSSLNSSQYRGPWTQVVRKGMQNQGTFNQPAANRYHNRWTNDARQSNFYPNTSQTQPFIRDPSRSIASLPKRASLISPNSFAVLNSHSINEDPTTIYTIPSRSGPTQPKSTFQRTQRKSKKKCNNKLLPVIIDDDKQIDIILDTNILLSFLHFLRAVIPLLSSTCRILVPQAVVLELDMQKNRQQLIDVYEAGKDLPQVPMGSLARQATNWLLSITKSYPSNVLIQRIGEEEEDIKNKDADSRILAYANKLFLLAKSENMGAVTVLLSNDNILRLRAQSEGICSFSMSDFRFSPRQMMSDIRNFIPHVSIPTTTPTLNGSSSSSFIPPVPVEKPKLKEKLQDPPARSWVPSGQDTLFTFTSILPNIVRAEEDSSTLPGPDQELTRLSAYINTPRQCLGCQSDIQSTLQVSPDKIHHYCPTCCEVICRGCMKETRCDWDCSGPFYGEVCATMQCCAKGRAAILLELLGQLDLYSLTNQHKVSFKDGAKITHLYGDEALTRYLQATTALLTISKDDERDLLESILISSTLLDVLSQTLLSSPFLKWHFRSEVFMSAIKLIKTIFQSLTRPWDILNSQYTKVSTPGIASITRQAKIVWAGVIETSHQPNATTAKVDKLAESFPSLMADVKDVLRNQPGSSSTMTQKLIDYVVHVPLCYILENLFESSIDTEKRSSHPPTRDNTPSPSDLAQLTEALLDLKIVYESNIKTHALDPNTKSKQADHKTQDSIDSSNDQESSNVEEEVEIEERVDLSHQVNSSVNGQEGDDSEMELVSSRRNPKSHNPEVNGQVKSKSAVAVEGQAKPKQGHIKKETKTNCSVRKFFDKIDALSISPDPSSGSDSDSSIEVVHLSFQR